MAHIDLPEGLPGIVGPMLQYPETEKPLNDLVEVLLRSTTSLSPAEREMIATYVSSRNECRFCMSTHRAAAWHLLEKEGFAPNLVDQVRENLETAEISEKLRALLVIAGKVQRDGRLVSDEDVARARAAGADDRAIHDTVLIAAAFCMFNRYVDGLATWAPDGFENYEAAGKRIAETGYLNSISRLRK